MAVVHGQPVWVRCVAAYYLIAGRLPWHSGRVCWSGVLDYHLMVTNAGLSGSPGLTWRGAYTDLILFSNVSLLCCDACFCVCRPRCSFFCCYSISRSRLNDHADS